MKPLRLLPLLLVLATGCAEPAGRPAPIPARNLFHELLGKSEAELDAKLDLAWQQFFHGDENSQRLYFPVGTDLAYLADIGSNDVRTEGMSYGMMLAVQTGHREEFDRLWHWANRYMRHPDGPRRGYFAWHCKFDGTPLDPGSASDGEEWFAMALLFASHRWGDGQGIYNYGAEAQALLGEMLHKKTTGLATPIFNAEQKQVVFAPSPRAATLTDPSYHLPAFYDWWARWAGAEADRRFWAGAAAASRAFFHRAAHPVTGLMPDYAYFDGQPHRALSPDKGDFRYDAWRTLANVGLDYAWWHADPWQVEQSNRVLRFLQTPAAAANQFTLDGRPLSKDASLGLIAMAAVAGQAAEPALARPFVQQLWDAPIPSGQWRYYNGMLYFIGLLQAGGRFHAWVPAPAGLLLTDPRRT